MEGELIQEAAGKHFDFSVIIPVYNTERYLDETINCILQQDIGFSDHIQLILVNNGSEDGSDAICQDYANRYPQNIIYIKLKVNRGPSGARNEGMRFATGKYINFFDSDDKWSLNAFSQVYSFFEEHYNQIDVVSCRIRTFDAENAWHTLDYKFRGKSRVIDIKYDYNYTQLALPSSFVKGKSAKKYRFDESLQYGEDAKYLNEMILDCCTYGIMPPCVYYYRKRNDGTSLVQLRTKRIGYYTDALELFFQYYIDNSIRRFGTVIPYVQHMLMYDLQWRFRDVLPASFTEEQARQYRKRMHDLLQFIDDTIIMEQRHMVKETKAFALMLKYECDLANMLDIRKSEFYFKNLKLFSSADNSNFILDILNVNNGNLFLYGRTQLWFNPDDYQVIVKDNLGEEHPFVLQPTPDCDKRYSMGQLIMIKQCMEAAIPLKEITELTFFLRFKGMTMPLGFMTGHHSKLTRRVDTAYYASEEVIIQVRGNRLIFSACTPRTRRQHEFLLWRSLFKKKHRRVLLFRILLFFVRPFLRHRNIWLFSDRIASAGDSAECVFTYLMSQKHCGMHPYFILGKGCDDYQRIKKIGPVIPFHSLRHWLYFMSSVKIVSSFYDPHIYRLFGAHQEFLRDLCEFKFIYLQHGVIKDDMSSAHNKHKQNMEFFVTSGQQEYQSILDNPYGFDASMVHLTGLARHDQLLSFAGQNEGKIILIAPTWRQYIMNTGLDWKSGQWGYAEHFKRTSYYQFYNRLINDERLLRSMKENGYHGILQLHPTTLQQGADFDLNELFSLQDQTLGFAEKIKRTALLVTDYSSIAFDYIYAARPCIYTQFDRDEFYAGHSYVPGYYDYEKDGFGPVCTDYESTLQAIIHMIQNGCRLEEPYRTRRLEFFKYFDGNNTKRIYDAVMAMEG